MKLSICTSGMKDVPLETWIRKAADMGLSAVELWDGHIEEYQNRTGKGPEAILALLTERGLACAAISPYFDFLTEKEQSLRKAEKCVEYARALGAKIIRTFLGYKPSSEVTDAERESVKEALFQLSQMISPAEERCFALETHNGHMTDRGEAILPLLLPGVRVLFDGFNFFVDGISVKEQFALLEKETVHMHIKNYHWATKTPVSLGEGDVDFSDILLALKRKKSQIYLSFEYFTQNFEELQKLVEKSKAYLQMLWEE